MAIQFRKRLIDQVSYEACSVFDVNNDGILDLMCGEYWYEGPDFTRRHRVADVTPVNEYFDDFSNFPLDVDGDGWLDVITGGWWGETLRWRQNPGLSNRDWRVFDIDHCGNIETIRFYDIDGCGIPEVFPNTPNGPTCCYKLVTDASGRGTGAFQKILLNAEPSGHGLGFGDISGNGRTDVILNHGWLEHPGQNAWSKPWVLHPEFSLGQASVPILAYDVNHDGRTDLIVGQAHDYGLSWIEQGNDADGQRNWIWHSIDPSGSQFHDLQLVDLDNDGQLELVTGKRYRAHNDGDPGADDPIGIYYYKMFGGTFEKHVIDYGSAGEASGTGIYFWVQDVTGNGYPDLVAPGKDGLYLFENLGMRA
ncbi:MAG: VCBS repeat-containing protein [Firmicutes bacterium]|nr:VCBS repeat-containing protein [Bacillota bacterium]